MPDLERSDRPGYESLIRFRRPQSLSLHVVAQHQLLGVEMQIHLLVHPLGHRILVRVMLQWQQSLAVVLDEAQELQPTAGRPCPR